METQAHPADLHAAQTVGTPPKSPNATSFIGRVIFFFDLLICLANLVAAGWMINKRFVEKNFDYVELSDVVYMGIGTALGVAILGLAANLLMLMGIRLGTRFAWYRVALGIGTAMVVVAVMYMFLPQQQQLLSVKNRPAYLAFLSPLAGYLLWLFIYSIAVWRFGRSCVTR